MQTRTADTTLLPCCSDRFSTTGNWSRPTSQPWPRSVHLILWGICSHHMASAGCGFKSASSLNSWRFLKDFPFLFTGGGRGALQLNKFCCEKIRKKKSTNIIPMFTGFVPFPQFCCRDFITFLNSLRAKRSNSRAYFQRSHQIFSLPKNVFLNIFFPVEESPPVSETLCVRI